MTRCLLGLLIFSIVRVAVAQPDLGSDAQREAGRAVYMEKCAQCHGDEGAGDGIAAEYFRPRPRDFTASTYKFRSTASGELPSDNDIIRSIREGMPYTGMPAWPSLTDQEVRNLMYHLKTYSDDFAGPFGEVEEIPVPNPPSITDESIARGKELFEENQCFDCHGMNGRGNGTSAPTLEDKWEYHIKPADLTKRWTFRNGSDRQDIWRTVTTGLDGSPMPSYEFDTPEDKWALVNYVYSLSQDDPGYATAIFASPAAGDLDISQGERLFEGARRSYFPIVGQVIEPGRSYFSGINGIEAAAVFNQDEIAIMLSWHDMSAQTEGSNSPTVNAGDFNEQAELDSTLVISDAVALILPSQNTGGSVKPYFMMGDSRNSVDILFADLAKGSVDVFEGKGANSIQPASGSVDFYSNYEDGVWTAVFKRRRQDEEGLSFEEEQFTPVSFSVWDGFYKERGNRRGIASWYYVYLEPLQQESIAGPMLSYSLITLLLALGVVGFVRWKYKGYGNE